MAITPTLINGIINAAVSHAMTLGVFERVNGAEPKTAPGTGITCAIWVDRIVPVRASGLASTSLMFVLMARLYIPPDVEPSDELDPNLVDAADQLMNAYTGDFTLDGQLRHIDLFGENGTPLAAQAGWVRFDRSDTGTTVRRVMTITVPCVINDAWTQTA